MENIKELYTTYGELVVNAEIIQGRINEVKRRIAEALSQNQRPVQKQEQKVIEPELVS
jgi:hypothetical protein